MPHLNEDELILHYYREQDPDERGRAEEHLQSCPHCRQELADLARTLGTFNQLSVPERSANYGAEVWTRLQTVLEKPDQRPWRTLFAFRAWALAGSVAVLLVAAFWAGRFWQQRQTPTAAAIPAPARERILLVAVGNHLERSQMLLVEVMHQKAPGTASVAQTKQLAEDLVQSNRLYRQAMLRVGDPGTANVLDDLERTLLHIAHSPDEISVDELAALQRQIESQGILFKVRVVEMEIQQKQTTPRAGSSSSAL